MYWAYAKPTFMTNFHDLKERQNRERNNRQSKRIQILKMQGTIMEEVLARTPAGRDVSEDTKRSPAK